jgi:hypothetical protein
MNGSTKTCILVSIFLLMVAVGLIMAGSAHGALVQDVASGLAAKMAMAIAIHGPRALAANQP